MKGHIFDMDGLLIDSEPFWRKAEIVVFTAYGIAFTEEMCRETVGMRIDEVVQYWNQKLNIQLNTTEVANAIIDELIALVLKEGKPLPGVINTLDTLIKSGRSVALASSSNMRIIEAVIQKLEIKDFFNHLHSAEFEDFGKPHPAVFLTTAQKLRIVPKNCIVYEDSRNGMLAGLSAGMKVVIIPEFPELHLDWHDQAHLKWSTLKEFNLDLVETL